jgi:hypothetical protein
MSSVSSGVGLETEHDTEGGQKQSDIVLASYPCSFGVRVWGFSLDILPIRTGKEI